MMNMWCSGVCVGMWASLVAGHVMVFAGQGVPVSALIFPTIICLSMAALNYVIARNGK